MTIKILEKPWESYNKMIHTGGVQTLIRVVVYMIKINQYTVLIPTHLSDMYVGEATNLDGRPVAIGPKTHNALLKEFKVFRNEKNKPVKIFD